MHKPLHGQDVNVDFTRPPGDRGRSADFPFDSLQFCQERFRLQSGFKCDGPVEKRRLICFAPRFGFIGGGGGNDLTQRRQPFERMVQMLRPVTKVAAEQQEGGIHAIAIFEAYYQP